jgi:hypothetical protein
MLAIGSIATVIACIAAAALALGARLVPALIRGRGTDLIYPSSRVPTHLHLMVSLHADDAFQVDHVSLKVSDELHDAFG